MAIFKCKMCGATLNVGAGQSTAECEYCGTTQTLPKLDDERRAQMYDRANHFRRNNEFDKAMGIYEQILNEDSTDAEAYWSLVLCRYGIEYVEDPSTHRRMPTINRTQFTSIFDDEDYKSALAHADEAQKAVYRAEAETINEIQKGILAISQKEEPFDVFICYKETDDSGRRTPDSVLANELYHELTRAGFKVFFARITLEDKLGTAYEPYIFAALNSARVMVVIGTKPEYFNAVWVKNEWSRYLALIRNEKNGTGNGSPRVLIPAYRDMDPYDLPEEFSHLQAQDMSKLGFMQDLIRGIRKILSKDTTQNINPNPGDIADTSKNNPVSNTVVTIAPLLERAYLFLEDGAWEEADEYCEKVLDREPKEARAYLGKLLAALHCHTFEELMETSTPFDENEHYKKVLRFADPKLKTKMMDCASSAQKNHILTTAIAAQEEDSVPQLEEAIKLYAQIPNWKDADQRAVACQARIDEKVKDYALEKGAAEQSKDTIPALQQAVKLFESVSGWKDADQRAELCRKRIEVLRQEAEAEEKRKKRNRKIAAIVAPVAAVILVFVIVLNMVLIPSYHYHRGETLRDAGEYDSAIAQFEKAGSYSDAEEQILATYYANGVALREAGEYDAAIAQFEKADGYSDAEEQILQILAIYYENGIALRAAGDDMGAIAAFQKAGNYEDTRMILTDLINQIPMPTIAAGSNHTVGLKSDGMVAATGNNSFGQRDISSWTDIVAVSAGDDYTVGLKSDGMVVATGWNGDGECNVSDWADIVAVSAGSSHTVGLKSDGTVVATGYNHSGQCDVSGWTDIVAVSAGSSYTVGLKSDGTVVTTGNNNRGQCNVSDWTDIVAVSAGRSHTVGLKSDGTVVAAGTNWSGQCDVSDWTDIVVVSAGNYHTIGLKSDGTVTATGRNGNGQGSVSGWTDIVAVSAGNSYTVGLKSDGTVVATGNNDDDQCEVSDWTDIGPYTAQ